jgi:hypothetical protein
MAVAQTFDNRFGGIYEAAEACPLGGAIIMKGTPTGIVDYPESDGEFIGIGTTVGTRIPGKVVWAKNGNQNVQENLFFTNLYVFGEGEKTFTGGNTNVSGIFDYLE